MGSRRVLPVLACLALAAVAAQAQDSDQKPVLSVNPGQGLTLSSGRNYVGLDASKLRRDTGCSPAVLVCDRSDIAPQLYAGRNLDGFWSLEARTMDTGRFTTGPTQGRARGLDFNLVGRMSLAPSLNVFGKVGATYGRAETAPLGPTTAFGTGTEQAFGPTYGAGVRYDFSPRVSATLEWDTHDLRLSNGQRDPVRSTSLGLRFRY
jgi:opacity protein-like surface antigen